ncbi:alpha/beta fold hydrolase [Streptomyces albofaciens JCM 4342]|uniref:cytochrome P450 n=1 Tax=Streptomyces albofaciens TaxID=66866 RepID=UPI00123B1EC8|nr:cytochrome P450 [Streptomyces albofaciens]KAA6223700.1 alpha/beta fold hydrolase [Streptomyces albofaciens JCM 4342]
MTGVSARGPATGRTDVSRWLLRRRVLPDPALRLVCFPHAGGAATFFHGWQGRVPPGTEVGAVCYPGRQNRIAEPPLTSMDDLADQVHAALRGLLDRPLALFGHSMGAVVAYEVAVRLAERDGAAPVALLVSGHGAPYLCAAGPPPDTAADDREIAEPAMAADPALRRSPQLLDLVMPVLRADHALLRAYRPARTPRITAPIVAYRGADDPRASEDDMWSWRAMTGAAFRLRTLPGDHFYLATEEAGLVADVLDACRGGANGDAGGTAAGPDTAATGSAVPLFVRRSGACPFDPAEDFARLRAERPVVRTTLPTGARAWMVTRYADARRVIADQRRFSSRAAVNGPVPPPEPPGGFPPPRPGVFYTYEPEDHARIRRMLTPEFSAQRARVLEPRAETLADRHLDAIERAGPPADLITDFALPVPRLLFLELLGVPLQDAGRLHHDLALLHDFHPIHEAQAGAFRRLDVYLRELVRSARAAPGDHVLGHLVTAYGSELSDDELAGIACQLLLAGYATIAGTLGLSLLALILDPVQARLVRDGRARPDRMAEELIRHLSVVTFGKVFQAKQDVTIAGQDIAVGEYVLCHLPSANRDPALADGLDRLDVTREPTPHLALGHGAHHCLGAELARMELRVCVPRVLRRLPGLRLRVPVGDLRFTPLNAAYGVESLPVAW